MSKEMWSRRCKQLSYVKGENFREMPLFHLKEDENQRSIYPEHLVNRLKQISFCQSILYASYELSYTETRERERCNVRILMDNIPFEYIVRCRNSLILENKQITLYYEHRLNTGEHNKYHQQSSFIFEEILAFIQTYSPNRLRFLTESFNYTIPKEIRVAH